MPPFVPELFDGPTLGGQVQTKYRLDYLITKPSGTPTPPATLIIAEGQDVANLRNYKFAGNLGKSLTYENPTPLQIIGHNNIAELTFLWGVDDRVQHTLHWIGPNNQVFTTVYDISLNLVDSLYGPQL